MMDFVLGYFLANCIVGLSVEISNLLNKKENITWGVRACLVLLGAPLTVFVFIVGLFQVINDYDFKKVLKKKKEGD